VCNHCVCMYINYTLYWPEELHLHVVKQNEMNRLHSVWGAQQSWPEYRCHLALWMTGPYGADSDNMASVGERVCRWQEVLLLYLFNDVYTTALTAQSGNRRRSESALAKLVEDDRQWGRSNSQRSAVPPDPNARLRKALLRSRRSAAAIRLPRVCCRKADDLCTKVSL